MNRPDSQIAAARGFSRFVYPQSWDHLSRKLLDSPWTLQEARIICCSADRLNLHRHRSCLWAQSRRRDILSRDVAWTCRSARIAARKPLEARRPPRDRAHTDRERPRGLCRTRQSVVRSVASPYIAGETGRA